MFKAQQQQQEENLRLLEKSKPLNQLAYDEMAETLQQSPEKIRETLQTLTDISRLDTPNQSRSNSDSPTYWLSNAKTEVQNMRLVYF